MDFIICELFYGCEEIEWAIEEAKKIGLPVAATISIEADGDSSGIALGERVP